MTIAWDFKNCTTTLEYINFHNTCDRLTELFSSMQKFKNDYINIVKYAKNICTK